MEYRRIEETQKKSEIKEVEEKRKRKIIIKSKTKIIFFIKNEEDILKLVASLDVILHLKKDDFKLLPAVKQKTNVKQHDALHKMFTN